MGSSKGWKRKARVGLGGEWVPGGVGVVKRDGAEGVGGGVVLPEGDVGRGDAGEVGVELDAFDAEEGVLRGEEEGAAFAGADVEEDGALDVAGGVGRGGGGGALQPDVDDALEDAGGDAVVGGEFFDLDAGALGDDGAGDETGGVGVVELVEGVDSGFRFAGHKYR